MNGLKFKARNQSRKELPTLDEFKAAPVDGDGNTNSLSPATDKPFDYVHFGRFMMDGVIRSLAPRLAAILNRHEAQLGSMKEEIAALTLRVKGLENG